jgi:inorganic pyrophosphatase
MDEPAFPGCRLSCRLIGVIEGEQGEKGEAERNDRLVCVEHDNHSYAHVKHIDDLGARFEKELEAFFVNYHRLSEMKYRILALKGPAQARRCVKGVPQNGAHPCEGQASLSETNCSGAPTAGAWW